MAAMKDLLQLVRSAIKVGDVNITELAAACGVSREYIYKLLREDSHPTVPIAEKLAAAVGAEITIKTRKRKKLSA